LIQDVILDIGNLSRSKLIPTSEFTDDSQS